MRWRVKREIRGVISVESAQSSTFESVILLLPAAFVFCHLFTRGRQSLGMQVVRRWFGFAALSCLCGYLLFKSGWLDRSLAVCVGVSALFLIFLETAYQWMLVRALSRSEWPLFPRFESIGTRGGWPVDRKILRIKERLESLGYRPIDILEAAIFPEFVVRMYVMENSAKTVRMQLLCLPRGRRTPSCFLSFVSVDAEGVRRITDNIAVPFGGYYPSNWRLERRPWVESPAILETVHRRGIDKNGFSPAPLELDPEEDVNASQNLLESVNRESGFLRSRHEDSLDRISSDGRYRIWKEILLVNYLGRTLYG